METGTAVAIGVAVVGGLFVLNMISEQNRSAIAATQQVQQGAQQSPLGETGGAIFGALTGLGQGIASIIRASPSGGQKQPTRTQDGVAPGAQGGCNFNPALPISPTNTPVCGFPRA